MVLRGHIMGPGGAGVIPLKQLTVVRLLSEPLYLTGAKVHILINKTA